jgi:hypothetical protein
VVPIKLRINRMSRLEAAWGPASGKTPLNGAAWRGDVDVIYGEPIWFSSDTTPAQATDRLEEALAAL